MRSIMSVHYAHKITFLLTTLNLYRGLCPFIKWLSKNVEILNRSMFTKWSKTPRRRSQELSNFLDLICTIMTYNWSEFEENYVRWKGSKIFSTKNFVFCHFLKTPFLDITQLVLQWWYGEQQNVCVCTTVLSFHLPTWCKRKTQGWTEKMSVCAYLVLFPRSAREKHTWMDWKKSVCTQKCSCFHAVQEKKACE